MVDISIWSIGAALVIISTNLAVLRTPVLIVAHFIVLCIVRLVSPPGLLALISTISAVIRSLVLTVVGFVAPWTLRLLTPTGELALQLCKLVAVIQALILILVRVIAP